MTGNITFGGQFGQEWLNANAPRQLRDQVSTSNSVTAPLAVSTGTGRTHSSHGRGPSGHTQPGASAISIAARRGKFVPTGKVKLVEELSGSDSYRPTADSPRKSVVFEVQPELSEAKTTNYIEIGPEIRSYASLLIFMGSPARNFTLNAKFVSRTEEEASWNFEHLHLLKGWMMPDADYNNGFDPGVPRTLLLYAYGNNIRGIPTVMKSLNIDYPVDCDYIITTDKKARMPIILNVSMQLQETRTPEELEAFAFTLEAYKTGSLDWW